MIGFDYTERIAPAALAASGCAAVFRYTTRPSWLKSIARPEVVELENLNMPLVCNFESTADRMLGAASAGHADAVEQSGNLTALGIPPDAVRSWFSADWDVQAAEVSAVLDYLHAAADVLGGKQFVGCYGGLRAARAAMDAGFAGWQTVAWSGGVWDSRAVARQTGEQRTVGGVPVDVNQIVNLGALGAWSGGDMELTDTVAVTPGFAQRYPATGPDGFTSGAQISVSTLLMGAAIRDANNEHTLAQILAAVKQEAIDPTVLAAAIVAKMPAPAAADPAAVAAAVVASLEQHGIGGLDEHALAGELVTEIAARLAKGGA